VQPHFGQARDGVAESFGKIARAKAKRRQRVDLDTLILFRRASSSQTTHEPLTSRGQTFGYLRAEELLRSSGRCDVRGQRRKRAAPPFDVLEKL